MPVVVTCCGCSRQLRLPLEVIGSKATCPLCKTVFLTRSLDDGRAEALPVADAPCRSARSRDEDDLPPLEARASRGVPNLSLDEATPTHKQQPLDAEPADDDAPLRMIDDDPPKPPSRKRRGEDRPPRRERRNRREDEDDEDDQPRSHQRKGEAFASFAVFVHRDPNERLSGKFEAEADADGLKLWRGKGRILEVPLGAPCEYLGAGRLLVPIDGRKIELTTIHPDGLHDDLAREVLGFLDKRADTVTIPRKPRGAVAWLALLPLGLPVVGALFGQALGVGPALLISGVLGLILFFVCLAIGMQRSWTAGGRAWGILWTSFAGYLLLAIVWRNSSDGAATASDTIPGPWCGLAPLNGGFRASTPGLPQKMQSSMLSVPWSIREVYSVDVPAARTHFIVAHGDTALPTPPEQQLQAIAREFGQQNSGTVVNLRERKLDGKPGVEFEVNTRDRGTIAARAYYNERRIFAIAVASRRLPVTGPDAVKFLDSFAFDATTGWPAKR